MQKKERSIPRALAFRSQATRHFSTCSKNGGPVLCVTNQHSATAERRNISCLQRNGSCVHFSVLNLKRKKSIPSALASRSRGDSLFFNLFKKEGPGFFVRRINTQPRRNAAIVAASNGMDGQILTTNLANDQQDSHQDDSSESLADFFEPHHPQAERMAIAGTSGARIRALDQNTECTMLKLTSNNPNPIAQRF